MTDTIEALPILTGSITQKQVTQVERIDRHCIFIYVTHGIGVFWNKDQSYKLQEGSCLILTTDHYVLIPEETMTITQITLDDHQLISSNDQITLFSIHKQTKLASLIALIVQEASSLEGYKVCFSAYLQILIIQINRSFHQTYRFTSNKKYAKEILIINQHIKEHWKEPISLNQLAQLVSMSKSGMLHLYKRECGHTIHEEHTRHQLAHACSLLSTTTLDMKSIANTCGFTSASYFIQVFHKQLHSTPLQYRKASKRTKQTRLNPKNQEQEAIHKKRQVLSI